MTLHPLGQLLLLQARGTARRLGRGVKTPRGAFFFLFGLVLFGFWIFSVLLSSHYQRPDLANVCAVGPIMLLGTCVLTALTSAGDKAVAFTPGEVDMLFPGPFTRRQLLLYKLTKSTAAALLTSLVLSFALLRYSANWPASFTGLFLIMLFIQFFSTALVLLGQTAGERAYTRGRRIAVFVLIGIVVLGVRGALGRHSLWGPDRVDPMQLMRQFAASKWGGMLLTPFTIMIRTLTAGSLPALAKSAAQAALVDALLLASVVKLDANYLEAAIGATQRRHERLRRIRAGSVMSAGAGGGRVRRRLPQPPFLFGIGPIAWRQLTGAVRSSRGLLMVLVLLAFLGGPVVVAARAAGVRGGASPSGTREILGGLIATMAGMSLMLASLLRFDFRADLDAMDALKTLPLRSWAIAVGQLIAPTFVLVLIHLLLVGAVTMSLGGPAKLRGPLISAAILTLPFDALLFASENLIFLLAPSRPAAVGPGDFQILGRQLFSLVARSLVVLVGAIIAALFAIPAFHLAGRSLAAATVVAAFVLFFETVALIPLIARAYDRFDPSMHMPA